MLSSIVPNFWGVPVHGRRALRMMLRFCRYLLDKWDLALIPGYCFDAPGYVRLSFAASEAELISAMDRLAKGIAHLMQ